MPLGEGVSSEPMVAGALQQLLEGDWSAVDVLVVSVYAGARGDAPSLSGDNLGVLGGAWAALVLYAVIGVGVGALLRNQVGAIVGALVYLFVVEGIISSIPATQPVYKFLPGGALEALPQTAPGLRGTVLIETAGHWVQQEAGAEVNAALLGFLKGL